MEPCCPSSSGWLWKYFWRGYKGIRNPVPRQGIDTRLLWYWYTWQITVYGDRQDIRNGSVFPVSFQFVAVCHCSVFYRSQKKVFLATFPTLRTRVNLLYNLTFSTLNDRGLICSILSYITYTCKNSCAMWSSFLPHRNLTVFVGMFRFSSSRAR